MTSSAKKELRTEKLKLRKQLSKEQHQQYSKIIVQQIRSIVPKGATLGLYVPIQNEIDITPLFEEYQVALPKIDGDMYLAKYTGELALGAFQIMEPTGEPMEVDYIIVPGSVFDLNGYRIGYGGGYYDKYLTEKHIKIGVGFSFQVVEKLPTEAHDVPLDYLITEKEVHRWNHV